jgi:hypothetical protein
MPKLSDTMEEGTVVEWKKKSGDEVKTGEVLAGWSPTRRPSTSRPKPTAC